MERVMATYLRARTPLESDPLQQLVDTVLEMSSVCSTSLLTSDFPELRSELDSFHRCQFSRATLQTERDGASGAYELCSISMISQPKGLGHTSVRWAVRRCDASNLF